MRRCFHYNRFRTYDPAVGRYLSADPIGEVAGPNLYTYAANNPTKFTDPTGLILPVVGFGYVVSGSAGLVQAGGAIAAATAVAAGGVEIALGLADLLDRLLGDNEAGTSPDDCPPDGTSSDDPNQLAADARGAFADAAGVTLTVAGGATALGLPGVAAGAIVSNPGAATDFVGGALSPNKPPGTPAGVAGSAARRVVDAVSDAVR